MQILKYVTLFFLLLSSLAAKELSISDFKIRKINDRYFLAKKEVDLKLFEIKEHHPDPKALKVINNPKAPHLYFIVYPAGFVGTKVVASFYKAVIWNDKKKLFQGQVLYKVVENDGYKEKEKTIPAKWDFGKDNLKIIYEGKVIKTIPYK